MHLYILEYWKDNSVALPLRQSLCYWGASRENGRKRSERMVLYIEMHKSGSRMYKSRVKALEK